jgi:hypothetical protein
VLDQDLNTWFQFGLGYPCLTCTKVATEKDMPEVLVTS